eukprot:GHUV01023994.1.p2 GENE.GHUV01023994.1~~GHUV01023994.1.p2  ORF type:complete len:109 (-),score=19.42 GHUV01023994.1:141-467(-)
MEQHELLQLLCKVCGVPQPVAGVLHTVAVSAPRVTSKGTVRALLQQGSVAGAVWLKEADLEWLFRQELEPDVAQMVGAKSLVIYPGGLEGYVWLVCFRSPYWFERLTK